MSFVGVKINKSIALIFALNISVLFLLSACSSNAVTSKQKASHPINGKKNVENRKNSEVKGVEHIHPSNPCVATIKHSHAFDKADHQHSFDCISEEKNDTTSNGHIHPATIKTRRFRHVHPNGSNPHKHHR